jgi:phosphatidylethanolamine/phosphatidyl-N-methylethanolamine N-methyltransferase
MESTRSITALDVGLVHRAYTRLAHVYDVVFGAALDAGRLEAHRCLPLTAGSSVLEVGIGTGLTTPLYRRDCSVTGIDLSEAMLERATKRLAARDARHIRLLQMDATAMRFPDESFDVVYAAYVISTVPDPPTVLAEMRRVCRKGGYVVLLNHFLSDNAIIGWLERLITPLTVHIGFRADVDLRQLLKGSDLELESVRRVNRPPIWSLVTCRRTC